MTPRQTSVSRDPRTLDYARDLGIAFQVTNIVRDEILAKRKPLGAILIGHDVHRHELAVHAQRAPRKPTEAERLRLTEPDGRGGSGTASNAGCDRAYCNWREHRAAAGVPAARCSCPCAGSTAAPRPR